MSLTKQTKPSQMSILLNLNINNISKTKFTQGILREYILYLEKEKLQFSIEDTLVNIEKLVKAGANETQYLSLLKDFLNQETNNLKIIIPDKLKFAKLCLSKKIYGKLLKYQDKEVIDKKDYLFQVLQAYFRSENYEYDIENVEDLIKEIAQELTQFDSFTAIRSLKMILGDKVEFVSSLPKVLAQFLIIFKYDLWFEDNIEFSYFLQTFYFKKIMSALTTFGLHEAYFTTYIILKILVESGNEKVSILFDLINHKHKLFNEEFSTIYLILSLCSNLTKNNWRLALSRASDFSKKQFLRYLIFVYQRLNNKPGSLKRLIINSQDVNLDVNIQTQEFLNAWFETGNTTLINNIRLVIEIMKESGIQIKDLDITINLQEMENYFYLSAADENYFDISSDYKFKFDLTKFFDNDKNFSETKLSEFVQRLNLDNSDEVFKHLKFLIFQYNRCIHPPISLQALNDLKEQEQNYCKFTNIISSIYKEDEVSNLNAKEKEFLAKKYNSPFSPNLKLSEYFCSSCNNAYKTICGHPKNFLFNYKENVDETLYNIEFLKQAKKNKDISNLIDFACKDMRMINSSSCHNKPDKAHIDQIKK
jgi:hypothetical protein